MISKRLAYSSGYRHFPRVRRPLIPERPVSYVHWLIDLIRDPGSLIAYGYPALALVIFLETGAMIFFLPGDSLLVVAGFYAAKGDLNILSLNLLLGPMAIVGDACSYALGKHLGPHIFNRPNSRLLKPEHLRAAHDFYERHGGKAIILARFVPIVRTFVPIVAGVGQMGYKRFAAFNVAGGLGWVASMTLTGYLLGDLFPTLHKHVEKVIVVVIAVSLLPGVIEFMRARRAQKPASR
jgi:membrane-associated protein